MKVSIVSSCLMALSTCSCSDGSTRAVGNSSTMHSAGELDKPMSSYRSTQMLWLNWGDGGPTQGVALPIPVKREEKIVIAAFQIAFLTIINLPDKPVGKEQADQIRNEISAPQQVVFLDPFSGEPWREKTVYLNAPERLSRYGIVDPPTGIVGHFDDPNWLPKPRVDELRTRIFAGLDILLLFFVDPNRPWAEAANKAAQEVRDFFPLAAEPGLWPYYKAEGKEFFAWVEKNAPPGKAELPWHGAR